MILESTPYPQVLKTMLDERDKVDYFVRKEANKICTKSFREGYMPQVHHATYTIPKSNNTYLFWGGKIVSKPMFQNIGNDNYRAGSCLMVNTSDGGRTLYVRGKKSDGTKVVNSLMVYTSHFLRRYRERIGWPETMPTVDLICHFLVRNSESIPLDYKQVVEKWEDYPDGIAMQMCDGVILGNYKWHKEGNEEYYIIKNNTFLSKDLLKENQRESLMTKEKYVEMFADWVKDKYNLIQF